MTSRLRLLSFSLPLVLVGILARAESVGAEEAGRLLRTVSYPEHRLSTLRTVVSDTLQIEARLPSALVLSIDTLDMGNKRVEIRGVAADPDSGYSYGIERVAFSRFDRFADRATVFREAIMTMTTDMDNVESEVEIEHRGDPAVELGITTEGSDSVRRIRLVLHGAYLYRFVVWMPRASAYSARTDEIFSSIQLTGPKGLDLYASKLAGIIAAIEGSDEDLRDDALQALWTMDLDRQEKERIYELLRRPRADDGLERESLRYRLLHALGNDIDSTGLPALRRIYPTLATLPLHRVAFRNLLAEINTAESVRWLADLLVAEESIPEEFPSDLFSWLDEDISTTRYLFPKILPLLEHPVYREGLLRYLASTLERGSVEPSAIVPHRQRILESIVESADEAATDTRMKAAAVAGILVLEQLPPDDATITLLRSLSGGADRTIGFDATLGLLHLGQSVDHETLERIAAMPLLRLDLYRELEKIDSTALFPRRYLTQRAISESALAGWLSSDHARVPDSIVLAATREVMIDGEPRRAYLFKILYRSVDMEGGSGNEEWTTGLGSLQPIDPKEIDFTDTHAYSRGSLVGEMSIDRHVQALLEQ